MKSLFLTATLLSFSLLADTNTTQENNQTEMNSSKSLDKNLKKQIELEEKYKHEQKFYMGDDYDFKSKEIDPDSLKGLKVIEPEYDFDITDVYAD